MNRWIVLALLALAGLAVGCEDQKPASGGPTGAASAAALTEKDLPVAADFDDEAEKQITPANYKAELDTLEKEISAE